MFIEIEDEDNNPHLINVEDIRLVRRSRQKDSDCAVIIFKGERETGVVCKDAFTVVAQMVRDVVSPPNSKKKLKLDPNFFKGAVDEQ